MKALIKIFEISLLLLIVACTKNNKTQLQNNVNIVFLHHSTGFNIWKGERKGLAKLSGRFGPSIVPNLIKEYNKKGGKHLNIEEKWFPNAPYPHANYPYDYYNIWVKNAGNEPFNENPTLEILTKQYDLIILKHCFPYSNIQADDSLPDINSNKQTIANYKLQYNALKEKFRTFPNVKFLVWTGAALVQNETNLENAQRSRIFKEWLINEWNEPGDNIFLFDFNELETEGGLYMNPEFAISPDDSHPNEIFSENAAKEFVKTIIKTLDNN